MAVEGNNTNPTKSNQPSSGSSNGRSRHIKAFMTVGVVGYPNVGKSSVVNALTRSVSSAGVAALPGSTRQLKFVKLDSHTQLIDSPGVLFAPPAKEEDTARILPHPLSLIAMQQQQYQQPEKQQEKPLVASASLLLQSLLPVPQIPEPEAVAEALIAISSVSALQRLYQLPSFTTPREALQALAQRRGKLLKGGMPDLQAAAKMLLQEWQEGRVPYYSLPSRFKEVVSCICGTSYLPCILVAFPLTDLLPHHKLQLHLTVWLYNVPSLASPFSRFLLLRPRQPLLLALRM